MAALPEALRGDAFEHTPVRHVLTHRDLDLHFVSVDVGAAPADWPGDGAAGAWYGPAQWAALGLPAPVRRFLADTPAQQAPLFSGDPARGGGAG